MRIESDHKKTVGIMLALVAVYAAVSWWPQSRERADLEARVSKMKAQLGVDRKDSHGLEDLRADVASLKIQASNSSQTVPSSHELGELLRRLNSELVAQGISNQEVQTEAIVSGADFNVIPLTLRFETSFEGLFQMVKSVETMPRLTRINKLDVVGVPTKPQEPLVVRLELTTFSTADEGGQP